MREWSLIVDPAPRSGSWNMAVDEHLFRAVGERGETVVRFYQWARPTASLGYSQDVEKVLDLEYCRSRGIDVVRRITGGKLVFHDREVTYSVCSAEVSAFSSTLAESYRLISEALVGGLEKMGLAARLAGVPPASYSRGVLPCFSYPARDEIEIDGRKIVGSAQKRVGGRFLQHGSIPLTAQADRLRRLAAGAADGAELRLTSLSEALGREVTFDWAVARFVDALAEYFRARLNPRSLTTRELESVRRLERERYANPEWTLCGKDGRAVDFSGAE
jgi:lipoate-protein ligase A